MISSGSRRFMSEVRGSIATGSRGRFAAGRSGTLVRGSKGRLVFARGRLINCARARALRRESMECAFDTKDLTMKKVLKRRVNRVRRPSGSKSARSSIFDL